MDMLLGLLNGITVWHWLGLALILLGLEIALGTFDLLWISGAAFLTAAWAVLPLPEFLDGWQVEAIVFAIASVILLIIGRTIVGDVRNRTSDRPDLNQRGKSMTGKTGVAVTDFAGGEGRIKLGDTTWLASSDHGDIIRTGMSVRVVDADGTILRVQLLKE
mgnify:CR=1 FL=1